MRQLIPCTVSRRQFVKGSAAAATIGAFELGHTAFAAGSDEIKIALVGCGGRGTGAAFDALGNHTHSNIRLVEQHVHGIDACNWITRGAPVQATGVGGRRSGPSPPSAKLSITTASSTPVPMAHTASASADSNPAAGRTSATMPTGQRVLLASTAETRS
ncbi:MAG: hypothetical protein ACXWNW_11020 [Isosphaeraceae bacterium]